MKRRPTIRLQSALWILPLFLVLSSVSAWMSYRTIEQDLVWSFEEEAKSLAVAVAELVDRDEIASIVAGGDDGPAAIVEQVRQLRRWGQLHRLSLYDPEARLVGSYGGLQRAAAERGQLDGVERSRLLGRSDLPVWVEEIRDFLPPGPLAVLRRDATPPPSSEAAAEGLLLSAYAPVRRRTDGGVEPASRGCAPPNGELVAWVRVETHVDAFVDRVEQFRRKAVVKVLASCLLGLILVILLSRVVSPKLRQLTEAVARVEAGSYGHSLEPGSVREINDLATTFGTMLSVLRETVEKGRRSVMDREEARAGADIADSWARRHLPAVSRDAGDLELAATLGPEARPGSFVAAAELPPAAAGRSRGFVAALGRVAGEEPIRLAALAAAVPAFLDEHAATLAPDELLVALRDGLEVGSATLVAWTGGDDELICLALADDGSVGRRRVTRAELAPSGLLLQQGVELPAAEVLDSLTRWVAPPDAGSLLTHLQRLVTAARRGAALVIRPRESAADRPTDD